MIISIASGKGGTGKTTVATNFALSLNNVQLLDCDVEEPDTHIFIKTNFIEKKSVFVLVPQMDYKKCNFCGRCADICKFNAIAVVSKKVLIFNELCHSCGACKYFCPMRAIDEVEKEIGIVEFGKKNGLELIQGRLNIGEAIPIPVIKYVKKYIDQSKTSIIDAPPGTSCAVIESIKESDFCILVTEPTPFGLHDLILAVELVRKIGIQFGVIINRSDLGNQEVENYCKNEEIEILISIPFKKEIALAYSKGIPLIEVYPDYKKQFCDLLGKIQNILI